jgi:hypothetical protein
MALASVFFVVRFFVLRKKNLAVELFVEALGYENESNFVAAALAYTKALQEVRKIRFHHGLESKIMDKLKVMQSIIAYNDSFLFTR